MKHPLIFCSLSRWALLSLGLGMTLCVSSTAAEPRPLAQQVAEFLTNVQPAVARAAGRAEPVEATRSSSTAEGFLRYVGAPAAHHFKAEAAVPGQPDITARQFLKKHGHLFGATSPAVDFAHLKTRHRNNQHYVRLQQTYAGLPVFAAQVTIQLNAQDGIECVLSDIERDTSPLDEKRVSTTPTLTAAQGDAKARERFTAKTAKGQLKVSPPVLTLFSPSVVGEAGPLRLTWEMIVADADAPDLNERIFLDAHNGELVQQIPLHCAALDRQIYNANNSSADPGMLVRSEGAAPSSLMDADAIYDFLGDTYAFYLSNHGRDSVDDDGMTLSATAGYCDPEAGCPWYNAQWSGGRMYFGSGYVADDVVAHELTHGVTEEESGLVYMNAAGAMNESFSDCWGEFVDLTNGRGNDDASVRWEHGEDLTGGANRNMKDPTLLGQPDRIGSPYYYRGPDDYGGVHRNSGVNNKLCYLLTDGDAFNGQTVTGLGISRVAGLYYEVNANLLGSGADWTELYDALTQAAINLGWSVTERNNLYRACVAVEIASAPRDIYVDRSSDCWLPTGDRNCTLNFGGPFQWVYAGVNAARPGDNVFIRTGGYNEWTTFNKIIVIRSYDGPVTIGR